MNVSVLISMSYKTKILRTSDSGDGISVEAKVEGVPVAHTFPKETRFFDEPADGKPLFVEKLEEKYDAKMARQEEISSLSSEEEKIHENRFTNKTYE